MENRSLDRGRGSVPVVGLGTWRRLEAAAAAGRHRELTDAALAAGIGLVDTSPMYGDAERLLAGALDGQRDQVVIADKIWTPSAKEGAAQLSRAVAWYDGRVDLMQIYARAPWRPASSTREGRAVPALPQRHARPARRAWTRPELRRSVNDCVPGRRRPPAQSAGLPVREEDMARLSPFVSRRLGVHGVYSFLLPDLAPGAIRDLRDLDAPDHDEDEV